jgi:glycosyltransferase involved in cell wall biosynthesis
MRVLHVSHTATISGGEHSLLTLLAGMPSEIEVGVACPDGPLAEAVRDLGLPVYLIPATTASFRLHPVRTPRATLEMGGAALAVTRIARQEGATVLHANSVRAGLVTGLAGTIGGPPAAVHVRDVLPANATAVAVKRVLTSRSAELIAISEYVKERFGGNGNGHAPTVIDNAVNRRRFDPDAYDRDECRRRLGVETPAPLIGIVGQITPWKGHDVAVRAIRLVHARYPDARLFVVGEVKFSGPETSLDNRGFLRRLHELVDELGLGGHVSFLGERDDVPQILRALDALLVPSTVEPFGRTVAEAMTMATPVIATSEGGPFELLRHGVSGLLVAPGDEHAWARAIERLLDHPVATRRMAVAAQGVATSRFDTARHVRSVLDVLSAASGRGNGASP